MTEKTFFTSDTHFDSERTLELSKRPFESIKQMNYTMITNWNIVVEMNDIVYHLGDFGEPRIAQYLNGKIFLVPGNYDTLEVIDKLKLHKIQLLINKDEKYYKLEILEHIFALVHEPINYNGDLFKLFGHIHQLQMVKRNSLNVGIDCHNFYTIDLDLVLFYKNAILNHYDENVFC